VYVCVFALHPAMHFVAPCNALCRTLLHPAMHFVALCCTLQCSPRRPAEARRVQQNLPSPRLRHRLLTLCPAPLAYAIAYRPCACRPSDSWPPLHTPRSCFIPEEGQVQQQQQQQQQFHRHRHASTLRRKSEWTGD